MDTENQPAYETPMPGKDCDRIYLIRPNGFIPDEVFKVFSKGSGLFFCRVGGQLYLIRDNPAVNEALSGEELLRPKRNFSLDASANKSAFRLKRIIIFLEKFLNKVCPHNLLLSVRVTFYGEE